MNNLQKLTNDLSVLYVEDDKESREQISGIFALLFKFVDTVFDGKDALDKFSLRDYDIVITDINMPNMNGIELIKNIKIEKPEQSIVIISAHNDSDYLLDAINLGVESFIIKPINMQQVTFVLSKIAHQIYVNNLAKTYHEQLEKELQKKTAELTKQYLTDRVTGLYNRNALCEDFSDTLQQRVVLLLGIDNFDTINITYGYKNGDIILKEIATFLKSKIAQKHHLYCISTNKFAVISSEVTLLEMKLFAEQLQKEIAEYSICFNDFSVKVNVSIALAQGGDVALKNAQITLKQSRRKGISRLSVYEKGSFIENFQNRIQTCLPKLQEAIVKEQIKPYFQAIVDNKTNNIVKYEALARMIDNNGNVESPLHFIEIAEATGILPKITQIMIDKTFRMFADKSCKFSINISEFDLNDGYLRNYLQEKLLEYDIEAPRVTLEVLEGVSAVGAHNALEQLMELKADGFSISIDDFGAQNSNFERVHDMEVDYIKIDGSFIKNIVSNEKSYKIAKTITTFAHSIGSKVIAEYVHSQEVQDVVVDLGIDYSQGYYFSIPRETLA